MNVWDTFMVVMTQLYRAVIGSNWLLVHIISFHMSEFDCWTIPLVSSKYIIWFLLLQFLFLVDMNLIALWLVSSSTLSKKTKERGNILHRSLVHCCTTLNLLRLEYLWNSSIVIQVNIVFVVCIVRMSLLGFCKSS